VAAGDAAGESDSSGETPQDRLSSCVSVCTCTPRRRSHTVCREGRSKRSARARCARLRYAMDSRTFFSSLATLQACSALQPAAQAGRSGRPLRQAATVRTSRRVLCRAQKSTRHKSTLSRGSLTWQHRALRETVVGSSACVGVVGPYKWMRQFRAVSLF
jgi:hypothetical protein